MFISKVPLVEFYKNLLPAARSAGYKMVLTAVAREADAPAFYDDLKRYWSSLHDVTGPDILFVFAGANAAEELNEHGLTHRREPVAFRSDQLAFEGFHEKKWKMHWEGQFRVPEDPFGLRDPRRSRRMETVGRYRVDLDEDQSLARDQTLEIYSLSRFLGVHESQLPCLVLTLLKPNQEGGFGQVSISFEHFASSTLYLYVKQLAEDFEDLFETADQIRRQIDELQQTVARTDRELHRAAEPLRRAEMARSSVRHYAKQLQSQAASAVAKILELTESCDQSSETRSECYREFRTVKAAHPQNWGIIPDLQRLIDLSFKANMPRDSIRADNVKKISDLQRDIRKLERKQSEHWRLFEDHFEDLTSGKGHNAGIESCDFFIAYSSADRSLAERAFSELSRIGRAFLDSRCLRPGERWTERIRTAQDAAKCTVLLITGSTPNGWYTESEYLHAIELVRNGNHVLIPVLYGEQAQLPYGLEQIHAVRIDDWSDLERLPALFRHFVQSENNSDE